ncbi:hypothetical protein EI555_001342, partial [Monodon monoceros]
NSMAKAAIKELATLYSTKYKYGPGASTICKSWRQNCAKNPRLKGPEIQGKKASPIIKGGFNAVGEVPNLRDPAAGGSDDWAYDQGIKYSFTFELRDKGRYGFALPESQIRPTCEETMLAIKYITGYVLEHLLQTCTGYSEVLMRKKTCKGKSRTVKCGIDSMWEEDYETLLHGLHVSSFVFLKGEGVTCEAQDEKQANIIKDLAKTNQLDFWYPDITHHVAANMTVDFRISEKEFQSIQAAFDQNRMHYEILIHDVQEEVEKQSDVKEDIPGRHSYAKYNNWDKFDVKEDIPGRHSYAKYNNWDKTVAWTEKMVHKHPKMVSRIKIGTTVEDNPLYVLKIGEKDERRKAIFMDCGIHAREWISPAFCQWFVYQATKTYGKNKIMTKLLDRMNFYVLPVFNVDGYIWSWRQDRMWRKNRSKNQRSKCIGTDLNRNFNVSWNSFPHTKDPCREIYGGPAPESEKETKAVTDFIRSHRKSIKAYLTFHSYSQMLLFPYGYTSELPPNHEEL